MTKLRPHSWFIFLTILFLAAYLIIGIQKYNRYQTSDDLAIYSQTVWQVSRLQGLNLSLLGGANTFQEHFEPILIVISPLYWLWPDPRTLIILQELILVAGSMPVYLLARKLFPKKRFLPFVFSFLYLFFIGIQSAVDFDFHTTALTATGLSFVIYFLETKKLRWFWIAATLTILTKEDAPVYLFALSLYAVFIKKYYKQGAILALVSIAYYFSIYHLFLPTITGQNQISGTFGGKSANIANLLISYPDEFIKVFFVPEIKLRNMFLSLGSFGFLPLLSPLFYLLAPVNFLRYFSDPARWSLHFHYASTLTPILAISAVLAFKKIIKFKYRYLLLTLAIIGTFYTNRTGLDPYFETPPVKYVFRRSFYIQPLRNIDFDQMIRLVPLNSSISAQVPLVAHLTARNNVYLFPKNWEGADYVALTPGETPYPMDFGEMVSLQQRLLSDPGWEKVYQSNFGVLLKKKTKL